jgi:uncharacterized membrane protein YphA (DoxX/SURF4 family)
MGLLSKVLTSKYTSTLLRLLLGGLFLFAGLNKIVHLEEFKVVVSNYRLLPGFAIIPFASILAWIELVAGVFLIAGLKTKASTLTILILLILFMIGVGISLLRGLDIECGCFDTKGGQKMGMIVLLKEVSLFALGLQILLYDKGFLAIDSLLAKRR